MSRIEKILQLLKQTPDDDFLQHALALERINEGNDNDAENLFRTLLQRNPNYVGSYYHYIKLLLRLNKKEEAIKNYKQGVEVAKALNETKALSELRSAYEELE